MTVNYEFLGVSQACASEAAQAMANAMDQLGSIDRRDKEVVAAALDILGDSWDNDSLQAVLTNCSFSKESSAIKIVVWAGTIQKEFFADSYAEAKAIVDKHHNNSYDPQFYDSEGNTLVDTGFGLCTEEEAAKSSPTLTV